MRPSRPSSTVASGSRRENFSIAALAMSRNSSSGISRRAMPTRLKRSGSAPSWARLYSAGSSLRWARSPVTPKIVRVVAGTGRRSSPSISGFSPSDLGSGLTSTAISGLLDLLHRVSAELVAQGGQDAGRVVAFVARVEAGKERGGERGRRDRHLDPVGHHPAALAGVVDVAAQALEVVALLVERALGELAQPGAHDRAAVPQPRDLLELDREFGLVHQVEALGVGLHHPVLDAVVDHLHEVPGAGGAEVPPAVRRGQHVQDRSELRDRLVGTAGHHAVTDVEAPDAARGADVGVADAVRLQLRRPAL